MGRKAVKGAQIEKLLEPVVQSAEHQKFVTICQRLDDLYRRNRGQASQESDRLFHEILVPFKLVDKMVVDVGISIFGPKKASDVFRKAVESTMPRYWILAKMFWKGFKDKGNSPFRTFDVSHSSLALIEDA